MTKLEKYFDYRSNDRMLWCVIPEDRENWKVELVECDSFRRLVMVFLGCWTRRSHWWSAWCIDRALLLMLWQILLALLSFHTRMCTHIFLFLFTYIYTYNLVGGFNPSQKYESQIGIIIPNIWEKKAMFQTTSQWLHKLTFTHMKYTHIQLVVSTIWTYQWYPSSLFLVPSYCIPNFFGA